MKLTIEKLYVWPAGTTFSRAGASQLAILVLDASSHGTSVPMSLIVA